MEKIKLAELSIADLVALHQYTINMANYYNLRRAIMVEMSNRIQLIDFQ